MPTDGKHIYNPFGGGVQMGFVAGGCGFTYQRDLANFDETHNRPALPVPIRGNTAAGLRVSCPRNSLFITDPGPRCIQRRHQEESPQ